jgi:hypothetical protein
LDIPRKWRQANLINELQSPCDWSPPKWHPDFGDPALELDDLKEFSLLLLSMVSNATVTLETPEPGLMDVRIDLDDGRVAEVHSVQCANMPKKRRLALFLAPGTSNEEEIYAESIPSAVNSISKWLS